MPSDEDAFEIPDHWDVIPRRGGRRDRAAVIDREAAARARGHWSTKHIELALDHPDSDPEIVRAMERQLDGDESPLGTAGMLAVQGRGWPAADMLADGYGFAFAARTIAELSLINGSRASHYNGGRVWFRPADEALGDHPDSGNGRTWHWSRAAERLRALLADAGDADYRAAVAALAEHRRDSVQRVVVSFLVPTETAWVDECCADVPAGLAARNMLLCSVSSPEQVAALGERAQIAWEHGFEELVATTAEGIGAAIVPLLAGVTGRAGKGAKSALELLSRIPTDEAFDLLLDCAEEKNGRPALAAAMERFPARSMRLLAGAAAGRAQRASTARLLLAGHVRARPDVTAAVLPGLGPKARAAVEGAAARDAPDAPASSLPPLLVAPPWLDRPAEPAPVVIAGLKPPAERSVVWAPGERETWAPPRSPRADQKPGEHEARVQQYLAGRMQYHRHQIQLFIQAPDEIVRPLLADWDLGDSAAHAGTFKLLVGRHGSHARAAAFRAGRGNPAGTGEALLPFLDAEVAALMAGWLVRTKSARGIAEAYFRKHGLSAVRFLVPDAFGKRRAAREGALAALRSVAAEHGPGAVAEAAREHGPEAVAALPGALVPPPESASRPEVGPWVNVRALPEVRLREGGTVLPAAAAEHLVGLLALGHPGLDAVRDLCDPAPLAEFGWALFDQWRSAGTPPPAWPLTALEHTGDDETVRRLTPLIKAWPGEGGHLRAVAGVGVLAAIGTETALVHLNGIAERCAFAGLKRAARQTMRQVAAGLGLTAEQLADRLAPDFGLDAGGRLLLDYGPRRFTVAFDEHLRPQISDENGAPRKSLPAPGARDDADLAQAARKRFADLKKDVRAAAGDQIRRLESAMVAQRRWTADEFRRFFVDHPLVWHLARRLVWTTGTTEFRIAEDRTFATAADEPFDLPDGAQVRIVHPVFLRGAWPELFADYQLLQPFPQLGRDVHALTGDERAGNRLTRFEGVPVPTGKVIGLARGAWQRGAPGDGGVESEIVRPLPHGRRLIASLDPGIAIGMIDLYPEQRLHSVTLTGDGRTTFADLDPVTASEILAELTTLTTLTT